MATMMRHATLKTRSEPTGLYVPRSSYLEQLFLHAKIEAVKIVKQQHPTNRRCEPTGAHFARIGVGTLLHDRTTRRAPAAGQWCLH